MRQKHVSSRTGGGRSSWASATTGQCDTVTTWVNSVPYKWRLKGELVDNFCYVIFSNPFTF